MLNVLLQNDTDLKMCIAVWSIYAVRRLPPCTWARKDRRKNATRVSTFFFFLPRNTNWTLKKTCDFLIDVVVGLLSPLAFIIVEIAVLRQMEWSIEAGWRFNSSDDIEASFAEFLLFAGKAVSKCPRLGELFKTVVPNIQIKTKSMFKARFYWVCLQIGQ